ncbi:MAG: hypothetical protein M5U19_06035 [Microthrixaceae bacterium]|nr:hypothetical protein [Microthrixaceae bacterium]
MTVVVVGIIGGAYMLGRSGGDDIVATESTTTTSSSTTTEATTTTTTTKVTTSTTAAPPTTIAAPLGNVLQEPDGLLCKDLEAKGYSYSAAVDYWRSHGQPNRMDSDRNGIPCETVYPRSDVVAYWPHRCTTRRPPTAIRRVSCVAIWRVEVRTSTTPCATSSGRATRHAWTPTETASLRNRLPGCGRGLALGLLNRDF